MHRILFILILVPIFVVKAATPFVSVAVQPTLTLTGYSWAFSHEGGSLLNEFYYTYAGGIAAGVGVGRNEFYLDYNWKNSHAEITGSSGYSVTVDSLETDYYTRYRNRLKDQRAKIGYRRIISENANRTISSMIGFGVSIGTTKKSETETNYESRYIVTDSSHTLVYDRDREWVRDDYSLHSLGWFIEMGSKFSVHRNLAVLVSGQLHSFVAEYPFRFWFGPETLWDYYIEPSLSVALRWDFGRR